MLVHIVMFNFKDDLTEEQRQDILEKCRTMLPALPGVTHLLVGKNIKDENEFEYALSMYFQDEQALQTYRHHPDHEHFRDVLFFPFLDKVKGFDFAD